MLQWMILLTLLVHSSFAYSLYDDIDDYHLWRRGEPSVATTASTTNKECKKDILILWDCSNSINFGTLKDAVIPFLKGLVNNKKLNVGENGTHVGFITFSTKAKTKILLRVGEKQDPVELTNWLDRYTQDDFIESYYATEQMGPQTHTGQALKLANYVFSSPSPSNFRKSIGDVVLMFTDGRPNPDKGSNNEIPVANKYSQKLKEKKVKIVGLAAGKAQNLLDYSSLIKNWSSKPSDDYFFKTELKNLEAIVDKLVGPLCIPAGITCRCDSYVPFKVYTEPGRTEALVKWEEPDLSCSGSVDYNKVQPDTTSPARFALGPHSIAYSFWLVNEGKRKDFKCFLNFTVVEECKCPGTQTKYGEVTHGDNTAFISWEEPKPDCSSTPSEDNRESTNDEFTAGKHTLTYIYTHKSLHQEFNMECHVNIVVSGEFCGETVYEPATHVCCCGKSHERKSGYKCCGENYYHPSEKICCQEGILAPLDGHCPAGSIATIF